MTSIKYILLTLCALGCVTLRAAVIHYTADDRSIFPNPERGFTEELGGETRLSDARNHVVLPEADWFFDLSDPDNADRASQSLVVLMYYLYNYRSTDLTEQLLRGLDEDMALLRQYGYKCVLRFAYDWNSNRDAEQSWVQRHIAQLKPYLTKNSDVIYVLEAGFVGQWGEWYYSSHFGNETQALNAARRQVLEALLDACPNDRFLLVRYPLLKIGYLGDEQPLTSEQAYSGTPRARMGHHNDAFLNAWGNDGTYGRDGDGPDDDPLLRAYIAEESLYVPNGGETNVEDNEDTPGLPAMVYDQAVEEMSRYHWSFCGASYSEEVTDRWRASGIFDELNRRMGYRYQLIQATLPDSAAAGERMPIQIRLTNVGFAPLYNERKVYIVLRGVQNTEYRIPIQSDPRRWLPNGAESIIAEEVMLPADIPAGAYQLYLYMPDIAPSLASDPRYAIRFANVGTWDAATGMNSLQASISIRPTQSALPPVPADEAPTARKLLRYGQVLILRAGKTYTITGQELAR